MKILHIETAPHIQSASYRIHNALLKESEDSYIYISKDNIGDHRILQGTVHSGGGTSKIIAKAVELKEKVITRAIRNFFCTSIQAPVSFGIGSTIDKSLVEILKPDVINLHWICGEFVSTADLGWLSKYPLVWTLHDSWAFTGGCHVPQLCRKWEVECEQCVLMGKRLGIDLAKKIFARKEKIYAKADFKVIGASKWIADCARRSALFRKKEVFCVHNTLNQEVFKPKDKHVVREILGLPHDKKIILFGAMNSTSDANKGFDLLHAAICHMVHGHMVDNLELMVFGSGEPQNPPDFGVKVHYMGRFHDDLSLSILYSAADIMIVPSRSENFPNTAIEAISCGTPVAAFRIGGIPDQIDHKINGYLAEPYDSEDLARGIAHVLEDEARWKMMSQAARQKAVKCFNEKRIAQEYLKVYESAIMANRY